MNCNRYCYYQAYPLEHAPFPLLRLWAVPWLRRRHCARRASHRSRLRRYLTRSPNSPPPQSRGRVSKRCARRQKKCQSCSAGKRQPGGWPTQKNPVSKRDLCAMRAKKIMPPNCARMSSRRCCRKYGRDCAAMSARRRRCGPDILPNSERLRLCGGGGFGTRRGGGAAGTSLSHATDSPLMYHCKTTDLQLVDH